MRAVAVGHLRPGFCSQPLLPLMHAYLRLVHFPDVFKHRKHSVDSRTHTLNPAIKIYIPYRLAVCHSFLHGVVVAI
jgi:hypothetical protein